MPIESESNTALKLLALEIDGGECVHSDLQNE